jgi:Ca2+-binding EF-hand superfamily protein
MERLFAQFDANGDGNLDLKEFLCGLSILSTKVKFVFKGKV